MKLFILVSIVAFASAAPRIRRQAESGPPYFLPASTKELLLKPEVPNFICPAAGYYADPENSCQVFHICDEKQIDPTNPANTTMLQYSFICAEGSVWDQSKLACVHWEDAIDCESAPAFYMLNDRIGRPEVPIYEVRDLLASDENAPTRRGTQLAVQLDRDREYGNYGNYPEWKFTA
jgi:hypothetical protein